MLHGDISVNGLAIGSWSALREESFAGEDKEYPYKVNLFIDGKSRYGKIYHKYSDGAAELVKKIMDLP